MSQSGVREAVTNSKKTLITNEFIRVCNDYILEVQEKYKVKTTISVLTNVKVLLRHKT